MGTRRIVIVILALIALVSVFQMILIGSDASMEPASTVSSRVPSREFVVVFVTHKRTDLLEVSMRSFLGQVHADKFDILVSLDAQDAQSRVQSLISTLRTNYSLAPDRMELVMKPAQPFKRLAFMLPGDQKIDQHMFFALKRAFFPEYKYGILLEEDLELSPDFLDLMVSAAPLLDSDDSLFCISGWNDDGSPQRAAAPGRLIRTDVFNNLSFLLRRQEALKIIDRWPGYDYWGWDHWFRREVATKQRECIVPELSRVRHIGSGGRHVKDNSEFMLQPFSSLQGGRGIFDASLRSVAPEAYDAALRDRLEAAQLVDPETVMRDDFSFEEGEDYIVPIKYEDCADYFLMRKASMSNREVCRMTHRGLVEARPHANTTVFFVDRRAGAEWLPSEWRTKHAGLRILPTSGGQSCDDRCAEVGFVCSSHDAAHVNTCDAIESVITCETCSITHEHRGAAVSPPTESGMWSRFRKPTTDKCFISDQSGFFCDDPSPQERSILCPCVPTVSFLKWGFDYNRK